MYLEMERTDLEFEFFLAQKLGMTVGEMRLRMSCEEYTGWGVFYNRKAQREELERLRSGR